MSETESALTKNDVLTALKEAFRAIVLDALEGASGDLQTYGQQIMQEFGHYLLRSVRNGDAVAAENLRDLKIQVMLIATKRSIIIANDIKAKLLLIVEIAAKFAVKAAIAAAAAA